MDTAFCTEAVEEAIARYGKPDMFNTDQGSQFTSSAFTGLLLEHGIRISMDGKGCWRDNVFIERVWRSIKSEEVYLHACDAVSAAREGIGRRSLTPQGSLVNLGNLFRSAGPALYTLLDSFELTHAFLPDHLKLRRDLFESSTKQELVAELQEVH